MELDIPDGEQIKKNFVGKHMANYDSILSYIMSKHARSMATGSTLARIPMFSMTGALA